MKKLGIITVVSGMLLSLSPVSFAATNGTQSVSAFTFDNVPSQAGKMNLNHYDQSSTFLTANISGSEVNSITGSLDINGVSVPFSLHGKLYDGILSGRVEGVLTDQMDNYDVVRFELLNDPAHSILVNRNLRGDVLALYLQRKGDRDLTVIECPVESVHSNVNLRDIFDSASSFSKSPSSAALWFERYFHSDNHGKNVTGPYTQNSAKLSPGATSSSIQPLTSVTKQNYYADYYDQYNFAGYSVQDTTTLQEQISEPSDTGQPVIGELSVYSTDYNESNGTDLKNSVSGWEVGGNGSMGLKLNVASPQGIEWESVAGQVEQSGTVTFNMSFSPSYYGISATLQYNPPQQVYLGAGNKNCNGAGVADFYSNPGTYLNQVGDSLSVNWQTAYYSAQGSQQTVTDTVNFIYDMYNANDGNGYDIGQQWDYYSFSLWA